MTGHTAAASGPDAVLADLLGAVADQALDLDPAGRARLSALDGCEIRITMVLPPPLGDRELTVAIADGHLRCFARRATAPNVAVRGTAPDLAAWLLGLDTDGTRLQIDGDTAVLTGFAGIVHGFRPDLEGPLSRLVGRETAHTALGTAELAVAGLRSALEGAGRTLREQAAHSFVTRAQADRFLDALDDMRLRVDRLGARVAAQEQRRTAP